MTTTNATTNLTDGQAVKAAKHVYPDGCPPTVAHRLIKFGRIWVDAYGAANSGHLALCSPDQAWRDVPAGTPEQVRAAVMEADAMAARPRQERFPGERQYAPAPVFPRHPLT
jgi:hypothetical protein